MISGLIPLRVEAQAVISELMINPVGGRNTSEWIELENLTDEAVQLGGWKLFDTAKGIEGAFALPETIIGGKGLLVLEYDTTKIGLNNDGDTLTLTRPDESVVDKVTYGKEAGATPGKTWSRGVTNSGAVVYELSEPTRGSPNIPQDLPVGTQSTPSITTAPSITPRPISIRGMVLSEVYACPKPGDVEWIELFNTSNSLISEASARFKDRSGNIQTVLITAPARELVVFEWPTGFLNNGGDTVELIDANGAIIDELDYGQCEQNTAWIRHNGNWQMTTSVTKGQINRYSPLENTAVERGDIDILPTQAINIENETRLTNDDSETEHTTLGIGSIRGISLDEKPEATGGSTVLESSAAGRYRSDEVNEVTLGAGQIYVDTPDAIAEPWLLIGGTSMIGGGLLILFKSGKIEKWSHYLKK